MSDKVDFISGCPAIDCENSKKKFIWEHSFCGGKEWIDEKGNIECKECHTKDLLISWRFKCKGHNDYREVDKNEMKICEILSVNASLEKGNKKFKSRLLKAIANMIDIDEDEN